MSRVDEALARSRAAAPADLAPPVASVIAGTDSEFPSEPASAADSEPAVLTRHAEEPPEAEERAVVEIDGDPARLRSADKLMFGQSDSPAVEQYRRLAARLLMAQAEQGTRLVMITSALPNEGKTLTSANLALTLSESYRRQVLLIDGDLRRPWVHELFEVPNVTGLNDGLRIDMDRKIPLLPYTDNLSILTAGRPDSDPMGVLSGENMKRVLQEAAKRFDFVIVDTPPVALLPDAHLLSNMIDAVLLVVESGRSPLPSLKRAIDAVGRERILGVVLNRAERGMPADSYGYYSGYSYYGSHRRLEKK